MKALNLTGTRFGRLRAIKRAPNSGHHTRWLCRCDCGNQSIVHVDSLRSGNTISCGCYHREATSRANSTHRQSAYPIYRVWASMKQRCYDKSRISYPNYGGRGISICKRWRDSFSNFYADMGDPPPGKTLERRNNNGNYCKRNCRWATWREQANNKRNNIKINIGSRFVSLAQAARENDIKEATLRFRLRSGMSISEAIKTPTRIQPARKLISLNGKTLSMADWARELNINYGLLKLRLRRGWPMEKAIKEKRIYGS